MHLPLLYLSLVKFCFRSGQSCKKFSRLSTLPNPGIAR